MNLLVQLGFEYTPGASYSVGVGAFMVIDIELANMWAHNLGLKKQWASCEYALKAYLDTIGLIDLEFGPVGMHNKQNSIPLHKPGHNISLNSCEETHVNHMAGKAGGGGGGGGGTILDGIFNMLALSFFLCVGIKVHLYMKRSTTSIVDLHQIILHADKIKAKNHLDSTLMTINIRKPDSPNCFHLFFSAVMQIIGDANRNHHLLGNFVTTFILLSILWIL
ncbi:hypothetical protein ACJX0J_021565, partial [Zea mays]